MKVPTKPKFKGPAVAVSPATIAAMKKNPNTEATKKKKWSLAKKIGAGVLLGYGVTGLLAGHRVYKGIKHLDKLVGHP